MKQIKGASSHKINNRNIIKSKFGWQLGYGAYSVSESQVPKVKEYIKNQKEHHKKMTFQEECKKFIKYHGLFEKK